jgi:hypothetical protein
LAKNIKKQKHEKKTDFGDHYRGSIAYPLFDPFLPSWCFPRHAIGWTFVSIPLPAEVTGPYLPYAVLSEDNRTLAVFGREPVSPELFYTYFVVSVFRGREAFETCQRITGQKIYVSNWPPKSPEDYRLVAELPGISQIVAAAFSPDGKTLGNF